MYTTVGYTRFCWLYTKAFTEQHLLRLRGNNDGLILDVE